MKTIIKNVIAAGNYDLTSVLKKINTVWAEGSISDEEKAELTELARAGANASVSIDVVAKLLELEQRVKALENNEQKPAEEYLEFVVGKTYYKGDTCSFNGVNYICVAPEGAVCVWSPADYPTYWAVVE